MKTRQTEFLKILLPPALLCVWFLSQTSVSAESFDDFIKRDRQEFEAFREGRPKPAPKENKPVLARPKAEVSPERARAQALYNRYCELRNSLENPDPKRGYLVRIAQLRARLFPTGRPNVDSYSLWGDREWGYDWPLLQELEARVPKIRQEMDAIDAQWVSEGFRGKIGPLGDFCYGRKSEVVWLDTGADTFPSPLRTNLVDYVGLRLDTLWPTNAPSSSGGDSSGGTTNHVQTTPPQIPDPPVAEEYAETTNNIPPKKSWDAMTPDERHEALKANDPDAWINVYRALISGLTNAIEEVRQALDASGATADPPPATYTNLVPTAVTPAKPWKEMTPEERHEALKKNDPSAWDAVRDALLSGNPDQVAVVIEALNAKPIPEIALQTAYWHGYQLGLMEKATNPEVSQLDTVAAAYVQPALQALVRQGHADAMAGRPPVYSAPGTPSAPGVGVGGLDGKAKPNTKTK